MEVIEKSAEGLDRRFTVKVSAAELDERLVKRLESLKGRVHLKGFRKGKAPISFLKKLYGKGVMGEIVQEIVNETAQKAFADRDLQPASEPHPHFHGDLDAVIEGKADLEYEVHAEILPTFEPMDVSTLKLKRPVAEVAEGDVEEALKDLAERQRNYAPRGEGEAAQEGDLLVIDYAGRVGGEPFDGGQGEEQEIVLGSGRFIPGFEEQLAGARAGEEKTVKVTFPEDYGSETLAGKEAEFNVKVREVKAPEEVKIDDDLAKNFGLDNLDELKARLRERIEAEYKDLSRAHMKRALLDKLDAAHDFDLPAGMVNAEFEQIWRQVENAERDEEDKDKSEEELKAEYRKIAERRVRLGLVLAEIGKRAGVQVPSDQLQRAVQEQALREARFMQMAGRDVTPQQILQFYQQNPQAIAQIRAPLFEERVVDYIFERAAVEDKKVSKEELMKDPEGDLD
ncbi:trigger factor [Amphiplicatus metriothermophilus]|uniref:Trigger factor n=1 Tax=Amphiplicatus metriothermophilus TaxID=1519374 RepID=A0A239PTU1_9PROT|nr:trigger factor [Amphiplicatus metriothermophilus]MBB5519351.1 trigger factor [Amphiplicatus metriothermophilus]SNT73453.1 trigger factor [Amphiplicatus metriothermophilus]